MNFQILEGLETSELAIEQQKISEKKKAVIQKACELESEVQQLKQQKIELLLQKFES